MHCIWLILKKWLLITFQQKNNKITHLPDFSEQRNRLYAQDLITLVAHYLKTEH